MLPRWDMLLPFWFGFLKCLRFKKFVKVCFLIKDYSYTNLEWSNCKTETVAVFTISDVLT